MASTDYKVLVGDDDPAIRRLLTRWLEKAGYSTQSVGDGQEALEVIAADCPDFVITDWEMPRINGLELCRRVREMQLPHYVYILFLTVKSAPDELVAGLDIGADEFLGKPVSEGELLARMRSGTRILELERRLSLAACTDALTGLLTQRSFYASLAKEWHRSRRHHLPLSCVMLDIDFFKQVNDVHGHPAGDVVLKAVAESLEASCRASDTICRYGGEEFCIMLPETNEIDAAGWAQRTRKQLASLQIPVGSQMLRVTGSFGVAQCREDTRDSEVLVDLADQALLCAKRMGRDRVVRYSSLVDGSEAKSCAGTQPDDIFQNVCARDVMSPLSVCLRQHETIDEAAQFFLRTGIPSSPILDSHGALVGFLSERDLMAAMASPDCWRRSVQSVMHPNVISYEENTPIRPIYDFFCRVSIHRVVITKEGRPTGTISRSALLTWLRNAIVSKESHAPACASCAGCGDGTEDKASGPNRRSPDTEPAGLAAR